MRIPELSTASATPASTLTDLVPVFQDASKKAVVPKGPYAALVEQYRKAEAFSGKLGACAVARFHGAKPARDVLLVGFGVEAELTEEKARSAGGAAWARLNAERAGNVAVQLGALASKEDGRVIRAFAEGLVLGAYSFNRHKSGDARDADKRVVDRIVFVTPSRGAGSKLGNELAEVQAVGECVTITRDWSNEPSNTGTPEFYAREAVRIAKAHGLKARVLTEAEAAREKMGLYLAVGQGSPREGRIVVVEHFPKGTKKARTLALVGKGITFDSGGISIKPSMRMEEMKHDMTGAATVFGAVLLASRWKVPNHVVAVMAFTENMPSGDAIQPGNVVRARNGKTVEIINTDAEGRLILADVLDYACDLKPDAVVDVATLTGAVSIALGKQAAALLGNDDALIEAVKAASEASGERLWQLPLWDEYFDDMKSDTADMKNSCNDSYGGTIRGAIFLKQFIRKGMPWAHLDIAGTGYNLSHLSYIPKKGASGLYVRTLARLAAEL